MELITNVTPIGQILFEDGVISEEQLAMAIKIQEPARKSGQDLVQTGIISQGMLALMLEVQMLDILRELGYIDEEGILERPRIADIPYLDLMVRHP